MKNCFSVLIYFICISFSVLFVNNECMASSMLRFAGGPSGGTYQYYSTAISALAKRYRIRVLSIPSGGSIENIKKVNIGRVDFGVAYSGHVYQARLGLLENDTEKYTNVMAMSFFYGAPAQLVVKKGSGITSAKQLAGKNVGVGNKGSGAAANSDLFFSELGIWKTINKKYLGYRQAAEAFRKDELDAFWVFTGFPTASVIEAALQNSVTLIDLYRDAELAGMIKKYPYFSKVVIPVKTYKGMEEPVNTFQDSTVWIVSKEVSSEDVYNLLKIIFSEDGLKYMYSVHRSAKDMSIETGINGIVTPLHPGAEKFWKEKGVLKK